MPWMEKLVWIDTDQCKKEWEEFLVRNQHCIKWYMPVESGTINAEILREGIHSAFVNSKKIALNSADSLILVRMADIVRMESDRNYTLVHLSNRKIVTVPRTLKDFEQQLTPYRFMRIHKSHLINLLFLSKYVKKEGGYVEMSDDTRLPLSNRRREEFLRLLNNP